MVSPNKEEIVTSNIPAGELMNKRELSSDSSVEDVTKFSASQPNVAVQSSEQNTAQSTKHQLNSVINSYAQFETFAMTSSGQES